MKNYPAYIGDALQFFGGTEIDYTEALLRYKEMFSGGIISPEEESILEGELHEFENLEPMRQRHKKFPLQSIVTVVQATDETCNTEYIGQTGRIVALITNKMTGNSVNDPLHEVLFDDGKKESFWFEELKLATP